LFGVSLVQLSIAFSFYRCFARLPSVFEPVSLSHLPGGRIELISPLSESAVSLINAVEQQRPKREQSALLNAAVSHHRSQIRQAKLGLGAIGHLLAMSALEVGENRQLGAWILHAKATLFSAFDEGSRLIAQRDIVASNGAGSNPNRSHSIELFGTMTHKTNVYGVGYLATDSGLVFDIHANGKFFGTTERFAHEFQRAMAELEAITRDAHTTAG
jgi:carnitine O-acetyltransferase